MPADYLPKNIKIVYLAEEDVAFAINTGFIDVVALEMKPELNMEDVKSAEFFKEEGKVYCFAAKAGVDENLLKKLSNLKKFI